MTAPAPLLSVRDLAVEFRGEGGVVPAVRGVSFDLSAGRTFAVVGESGSGKSVTARAILRLLAKNARVTQGSILFRDPKLHASGALAKDPGAEPVDLVTLGEGPELRAIRGGRIAMIFQEPMTSLSPVHTVGDQVTEALRIHKPVPKPQAREAALALFERVGFREPARIFDTYPFELSGGMRQRAMIAMALICHPALLIADEPTTALDVTTQAGILTLIRGLQQETGMAVLFITHDLGVVANVADDIAVLYRGEVMESGSREAIFRAPSHPYLKGLFRAVPAMGLAAGSRLRPLREIKVPAEAARPMAEDAGAAPRRCPSGTTVLAVENVTKAFTLRSGLWSGTQQTVKALDGVSLHLGAGRTLGLVGESGSGKTTLARAVMRARGARPDTGKVLFDDGSGPRDVFALDAGTLRAYRRAVQFVFQDPFSSLDPRMTVGDILSEPLDIHRVGTPAEREARVRTLLDLVGLGARALRRYPHSFSGGERQRIGLARALALQPLAILCDEPTSALDVSVQAQVLNLLKDLQASLGVAFLFVSHNLAVVDYMAHDIAVMCRGRIVELAPRERLFADPRHPYTQGLLAAVPEPDIDRPLDMALVRNDLSEPGRWPAPFAQGPGHPAASMREVAPGHHVLMTGEAEAARRPALAEAVA